MNKQKTKLKKPTNSDGNCFQYAILVALNHNTIEKHPERIAKIRPFIGQYKSKERNFSSEKKGSKKFETNNKTVTLVLFSPSNREEMKQAHISKCKSKRENNVMLLIITDGEKSFYLGK